MTNYYISKIISGGQTGVDRAALDVANKLNIPSGGWCPKNRWAEDGSIPINYPNMVETPSSDPKQRTEWNVRDSDGTLVITINPPKNGTLYTIEMATKHRKPFFVVDRKRKIDVVVEWIKDFNVHELNVAGPRGSENDGIYEFAYVSLENILHLLKID